MSSYTCGEGQTYHAGVRNIIMKTEINLHQGQVYFISEWLHSYRQETQVIGQICLGGKRRKPRIVIVMKVWHKALLQGPAVLSTIGVHEFLCSQTLEFTGCYPPPLT